MGKKIYIKLVLFFFASFFLWINEARASHAMGVDISYEHISGETYKFTVTFYYDCESTLSMPSSYDLDVNTVSLCGSPTTFTVNQVAGTGIDVSPLCSTVESECGSGSYKGVRQYVYEGYYTFPAKCDDWEIGFYECNRNAAITTLSSPDLECLYIETHLDNTGTLNNNSPIFSTLPIPYICEGETFTYNHGVYDVDGDSLVFTLVDALDDDGVTVSYNAPYSGTYPLADTRGAIDFDSQTGTMTVIPNGVQVAVVTVQVDEYRDGVLIGSVMRDLQFVVQSCTNNQPFDNSSGIYSHSGGILVDSNSIESCPGQSINFNLQFEDGDAGDVLTAISNIDSVIPGASLTWSGTNPLTGTFSWTPSGTDAGYYNFTVTIQDDACPLLGTQVYSYDLLINQGTYAGPDLTFCPGGIDAQLNATGGTTFTWATLSGDPISVPSNFSCNPCASPIASPTQTTTYEVTSNLSSGCKNKDTVVVSYSTAFSLSMDPASTTICLNEATSISAIATGGTGYTYAWSPTAGLSSSTIYNPSASPTSTTTYTARVTDTASGCTLEDSVVVTLSGVGPGVQITNDTNLCLGETVTLEGTPYSTECDAYKIESIAYNGSYSPGGGWTTISELTDVTGIDQLVAGPIDIGFDFEFYCNTYSQFYISSNGVLGFESNIASFDYADQIPNAVTPNNIIAFAWDDLESYEVQYRVFGAAPNRILVIDYDGAHYPESAGELVQVQVHLYESTNTIEIHSARIDEDVSFSAPMTQGIENADGSTGLSMPSRNNINFAPITNDGLRFSYPQLVGPFSYDWTPGGSLSDSTSASTDASPTSTTTYTLNITDDATGCPGSNTVTVSVGGAYTLSTIPDSTICYGNPLSLYSTPSEAGTYTYEWTPDGSLDDGSSSTPGATPTDSTTYYVSVNNGGCVREDSVTILVASQPISATVTDTVLCPDEQAQLNVVFTTGCEDYTYSSISYNNSYTVDGSWTNIPVLTSGTGVDSDVSGAIPIGFNFTYYCSEYTDLYVTSNGLATFGSPASSFDYGDPITTAATPNNVIFMAGDDLESYSVDYKTFGTSPNRVFVVNYDGAHYAESNGELVQVQLHLYETSNTIEIHTKRIDPDASSPAIMTQGIENSDGTIGVAVPGRNYEDWGGTVTNDGARFSYSQGGPYSYTWTPTTGITNPSIQNPLVSVSTTTTYQVVQVDSTGGGNCPSIGTVTVYPDTTNSVYAGEDISICSAGDTTLEAVITGPLPAANCTDYTVESISYVAPAASGWTTIPFSYSDDIETGVSIGFDFEFFCNTYSTINVASDGWVSFSYTSSDYSNDAIPSTNGAGNLIAVAWDDLSPNVGGTVQYQTTGTAPNRQFELMYDNVQYYSGSATASDVVTARVILYESTNIIEIHITEIVDYGTNSMTIGIENEPETVGFVAGSYNNTAVSIGTPEAYRFTPPPPAGYNLAWSPSTFLDDTTITTPVASLPTDSTYEFVSTITGVNCTYRDTVAVIVGGGGTELTWTGAENNDWNNINNWGGCLLPACGIDVRIPAVAILPVIFANGAVARDVTIEGGGSLTINPNFKLQVCGDYLNSGLLNADPTSIVEFIGTGTQTAGGNMTGTSEFGSVHVTKPAGVEVDLTSNIDIAGDFIINSGKLDCNNYYMKVGGDFLIYEVQGFIHKTGTVEFNGSTGQDFYINR